MRRLRARNPKRERPDRRGVGRSLTVSNFEFNRNRKSSLFSIYNNIVADSTIGMYNKSNLSNKIDTDSFKDVLSDQRQQLFQTDKTTIDSIKIVKFLKKEKEGICEIRDLTTKETDVNERESQISYNIMQGRPSISVDILGTKIECLLDTGARVNVMRYNTLRQISDVKLEPSEEKLKCANDSQLEVMGKVHLVVTIGARKGKVTFIVVRNISPEVIGGIDMQRKLGLELQWKEINTEDKESYICEIEAKFGRQMSDKVRMKKAVEY